MNPDIMAQMKTRRTFLLGSIAFGAALGACSKSLPNYNFKMTLFVQAFGAIHSPSSVVRVLPSMTQGLDGKHYGAGMHGEATAVDCGDGRYIFALLRGLERLPQDDRINRLWRDEPTTLFESIFGLTAGYDNYEDIINQLASNRRLVELDIPQLPTIVGFDNRLNPTSGHIVNPDGPLFSDDASSTIARATIQITDEPVSRNIMDILPWLKNQRPNAYLTGEVTCLSDRPVSCLQFQDFTMGGQ